MAAAEPPKGADFSDAVKLEARRLAFFRCCYCHDKPGDQVHHLTPKEEGGAGVVDNAILLCVQCHMDYGHRADKRLQLRQARDHWYEIVAKRHASPDALAQAEKLDSLNGNVEGLRAEVTGMLDLLKCQIRSNSTTASEIASIGSSMVTSIVPRQTFSFWAPGAWAPGTWQQHCGSCGADLPGNAKFCPGCGGRVGST